MKNIIILLSNRIIKIIANLAKAGCYLFHFVFPNKRFVIPAYSKRLLNVNNSSNIPHVLWLTNYTGRVTLAIYINYLFNRLLAYNFDVHFMVTEDRSDFIKENFSSEIFESYSRIQIGAAQADFWRLLVLYKKGGVYMDIDAHLIWSLNSIIKKDYDELYLETKKNDFTTYFIASKSDNVNLKKMIDVILKNIEENVIDNVFLLTGPGILNQVLDIKKVNTTYYRYTCDQGNFTNDYFQYIDKPEGKWTNAQEIMDIIKK